MDFTKAHGGARRYVIRLSDGQVLGKVKGGRKMRPMPFDEKLVCVWDSTVQNVVAGLQRDICPLWPGSTVESFYAFVAAGAVLPVADAAALAPGLACNYSARGTACRATATAGDRCAKHQRRAVEPRY